MGRPGQKRNAQQRRTRRRTTLQGAQTGGLTVMLSYGTLDAGDLAGIAVGDTATLVLELITRRPSRGAGRDCLVTEGLSALVAGRVLHRFPLSTTEIHRRAVVDVGGLAISVLSTAELPAAGRVLLEGVLRARSPTDRELPSAACTWRVEAIERIGGSALDEDAADVLTYPDTVPTPEETEEDVAFYVLRLRAPSATAVTPGRWPAPRPVVETIFVGHDRASGRPPG